MAFSDDATIERLAACVIERTLPASEWTHAAHFAVALWLLRHRPALTTPEGMRTVISRYNESTGKQNTDSTGYHHTITRASIRAATAHLSRYRPDGPLHVALSDLMASDLGRPEWLLAFWRRETLFSVEARRDWVYPDLKALPF